MTDLPSVSAFPISDKRVLVAGHGMVGSAVAKRLESHAGEVKAIGRETVDLRRQAEVEHYLDGSRPDALVIAAAKVGGILANNTYPAEFLYDNLIIEANLIHGAHAAGINRVLFLGSSCIYPKLAPQPMAEAALLTGPLEATNEWYAIAKIAGIKLCDAYRRQYDRNYISAMPTNLYGPNDNFDLKTGHVLAALIHKIHLARQRDEPTVTLWGTGRPLREFMHVDDCADALVFLLENFDDEGPINVGTGEEVSILQLAEIIADVIGYHGDFRFDRTKPDGTPRKLMDSTRLRDLGWKPRIRLHEGIAETYRWFARDFSSASGRPRQ